MYTYVLFGRKVGGDAPNLADDVAERYQALLEAIESTTPAESTLEAAKIPREETNLFCIPAKVSGGRPTVENYNSDLAFTYRSVAVGGVAKDERFSKKLAGNAGPFLVSTLHPLNQVGSPGPMLFAHLSSHNPAAMREVINRYKQRVARGLPDASESFSSLRLAILNLIVDADDNIKLVKDAMAAWRSGQ